MWTFYNVHHRLVHTYIDIIYKHINIHIPSFCLNNFYCKGTQWNMFEDHCCGQWEPLKSWSQGWEVRLAFCVDEDHRRTSLVGVDLSYFRQEMMEPGLKREGIWKISRKLKLIKISDLVPDCNSMMAYSVFVSLTTISQASVCGSVFAETKSSKTNKTQKGNDQWFL